MIIFVHSINWLIFVIKIHLSMRRDWFFVLLYTSKCQWIFVRSLYTCRISLLVLTHVSLFLLTRVSLFLLTETTWRKCWGGLTFISGLCYLVFISRCQWFRYITSNYRLINGWWMGKVVEGRCSGIVRCIVSEFALRTEEYHQEGQ